MSDPNLYFRGHDRRGNAFAGIAGTTRTPAELVEERFNQRVRWMTVDRGGEEVGAVFNHPDTGKRTWWGEK